MANNVFTGTHTIVGTTQNGKKIVFTDITSDGGAAAAATVVIAPLTRVYAWTIGVKNLGATGTTYPATMTGNVLTITPGAVLDVASVLTVMSIGV